MHRNAASMLIADLGAALSGSLSRFAAGLVDAARLQPVVHGNAVLDGAMLDRLHAGADGMNDRRAIIAVWMLDYFETILPPIMSAAILLERTPLLGFEQASFVLDGGGRVTALLVTDVVASDAVCRFDALITAHLMPLIEHVAANGRVSPRILWSSAGHIFEAFTTMIAEAASGLPGLHDAQNVIVRSTLACGRRNPLFQPVLYRSDRRIRRVCCLRFLVPSWRICAICPLPGSHPSRKRAA